MEHHYKLRKAAASLIFLTCGVVTLCQADTLTLGAADNFAVLGLSGTKVANSLVTINGNEGIASAGSIDNMNPSHVNGNVVESSNGQYSGGGALDGGKPVVNSSLLSNSVTAADALYNEATALKATQVWDAINHADTITGQNGLNVIHVNGNINLNNFKLTLNGSSNDTFIVVVDGSLSVYGANGGIALTGGLQASNVLFVFDQGSGRVTTNDENETLDGTILAPEYNVTLDGKLNGELIGGGNDNKITLGSGALVNFVPFAAVDPPPSAFVPEPGTYLMTGLGFALLGGLMRYARRRRA